MNYDSPVAMPTVHVENEQHHLTTAKEEFNKIWIENHPSGYDEDYDQCFKYFLYGWEYQYQ